MVHIDLAGGRFVDRTGSLRKPDHQHRVHAKKVRNICINLVILK